MPSLRWIAIAVLLALCCSDPNQNWCVYQVVLLQQLLILLDALFSLPRAKVKWGQDKEKVRSLQVVPRRALFDTVWFHRFMCSFA